MPKKTTKPKAVKWWGILSPEGELVYIQKKKNSIWLMFAFDGGTGLPIPCEDCVCKTARSCLSRNWITSLPFSL